MAKKKDKGIKLSEKHGLNPSIECCLLCGKEMGIVLFGKLKGDAEAPKKVCTGSICDDCKKNLEEKELRCFVSPEEGKYITLPDNCLSSDYLNRVKDVRLIFLPPDNFKIIEDELRNSSTPEGDD